jgi:hypothetical protein
VRKQLNLKAVLDADLEKLLDQLGMLELMNAGKLKCAICGKKITKENFYCLYVEQGEIKFCCSQVSCYEKVAKSQTKGIDA